MEQSWRPIDDHPLPEGPLLIVSEGRCCIAVLVGGTGPEGAWQVFMDPYTDALYAWPTHWLPLPDLPDQG
ncbi:hypothetical protein C7I55_02425 [Sphingomonas deserti]|uniref:DUF551 domain-containing protein n=2 Tax=Allosphingosinicella deserti TaxID=2116704 RepID=A0A2P7QZ81_9SPHN|nr:hypothetical protein C7I55_02425 [Sphingomonas deserti]